MRALVTGATGFVGANLVRHLLCRGHDVSVLLRPQADLRRLDGVARDVRVATGDVADADAVSAALRDCAPHWVFHLAAHGAYSWQRNVAAMVRTNVGGATNLIDACGRNRVHALVLAGSSAEYGMCATPPVESDPPRPTTAYGVTKAAATALAGLTAHTDACATLTLRLYSVYGPWEDPARLLPTLVSSAMQGRWPVLAARDTMRDLVFVDDVCDAFILAAEHAAAHRGAVFNVGGGRGTTLEELTRAVSTVYPVAGAPHFGGHPGRPWDTRMSWVSNPHRIEHELGWQATTALEDGIRRLGSWIQERAPLTPHLASALRSA